MTVSLAALLIQETKDAIYTKSLEIAVSLGLPVTSWQPGDPTRSLYHVEAELHQTLEGVGANYASSGFLDYAREGWLKLLANQVYNVDVPPATFAATNVVLTNSGGGLYVIDPSDLIFKNSVTGKLYRNSAGGTLAPSGSITLPVVAEEAGSESSAAAGEIDTLVTTLNQVTVTNPTAAVGIDEQDESVTIQQCRDKLGSLSPNGPKEAYSYVARNRDLSGTSAVTRVRTYPNSINGTVTVYLAGPGGGILAPDLSLVDAAIQKWATPLCITSNVLAAVDVIVPISYEIWVYRSANKTTAEIQADVLAALTTMFSTRPIGGDVIGISTGKLHVSLIESVIRGVYPQIFRVNLTLPSADVALAAGSVAVLGLITPTINLVNDP
jgi:hypothetical protein